MSTKKKSGFVTIVGVTNAGKSTLVNVIVGAKVSIVSHKVQTTRFNIRGVFVEDETQIVFIDTPGIFKPRRKLDRAMIAASHSSVEGVDEILFVIDAKSGITKGVQEIIDNLNQVQKKAILLMNKVDLVAKEDLLILADIIFKTGCISEVFMISALNTSGVRDLLENLKNKMPVNEWYFPEDKVSDLPSSIFAAECTREKVYKFLNKELPYNIGVETEQFEMGDKIINIRQVIYVERESQKGIVLGHKGEKIKSIGVAARKELEAAFEKKVNLILHVSINEKWASKEFFNSVGLDFNI